MNKEINEETIPKARVNPSNEEDPSEIVQADSTPNSLKEEERWVCWEYSNQGSGKPSKKPVQPSGDGARTDDDSTWSAFDETLQSVIRHERDGVGFVFTNQGPYVGIDLDDCVEDGHIDEWAQEIVDTLDSYTEYSPSGTGLHIIVKGDHPAERQRKGDVEMYEDGQFFTVTGKHVSETPMTVERRQDALEEVSAQYLSAETTSCPSVESDHNRSEPISTSDQELLEKAKSADNGEKFKRLWHGDTTGYESHSEADLALCSMLAYWTGDDKNWIDRLFRKSDLYRAKWDDEHHADGRTYGEGTIETAISSSRDYTANTQTRSGEATQKSPLTLQQARDRCQRIINKSLADGEHVLVDALPAMGKSSGVIRGAANTGTPLTVFAPRHDLYEEYTRWCEQEDLTSRQLPSFHEDCPTASGEFGEEWKNKVLTLYERGAMPHEIHNHASRHFGEELPCDKEGACPFKKRWDFDPDEYDVLIGHYSHAYKPQTVENRIAVFDESPVDDFVQKFNGDEVTKAVSAYLDDAEDPPFDEFTDLVENRGESVDRDTAREWFNKQTLTRDGQRVLANAKDDAHALSPVLAYTVFAAKDLGNGWESVTVDAQTNSSIDTSYIAARDRSSGDLFLVNPPALADAIGVVGLDGTAIPELWHLVVDDQLEHQRVLDDDERREYISECLNYTVIQTAQTSKPYSGGQHVKPVQDRELFDAIARREDTSPALITSKTAISQYQEKGSLSSVGSMKNYGGFKGSNEFDDERVGIIAGSPHYGDDYVKRWGALADERVERRGYGMDTDYGTFGNLVLRNMREHSVFQALMRYGRDDDGATVYVHTAALPDWIPIEERGEVELWSDGMSEVVDELLSLDHDGQGLTTTEIAEETSISERMVRDHLSKLEEYGLAKKDKHPEDRRTIVWERDSLNQRHATGYVKWGDTSE
ncbi:hypothetical protein ACFR99_05995 [Haloarchaeobius amylolyticus]|uniref:NrS-1 polymerase-like HBD domain-containing protein n=1 Tax=Haloarchaeobius amylolyticus TaxID=1198296 RepID=A0ABD6BEE3_9EURY